MNIGGDDALVLAWQCGYDYALAPERVADLIDDARHAATAPPRLPAEVRYLLRMAEMEACAEMVARQIAAEQAGAPRSPWGAT